MLGDGKALDVEESDRRQLELCSRSFRRLYDQETLPETPPQVRQDAPCAEGGRPGHDGVSYASDGHTYVSAAQVSEAVEFNGGEERKAALTTFFAFRRSRLGGWATEQPLKGQYP